MTLKKYCYWHLDLPRRCFLTNIQSTYFSKNIKSTRLYRHVKSKNRKNWTLMSKMWHERKRCEFHYLFRCKLLNADRRNNVLMTNVFYPNSILFESIILELNRNKLVKYQILLNHYDNNLLLHCLSFSKFVLFCCWWLCFVCLLLLLSVFIYCLSLRIYFSFRRVSVCSGFVSNIYLLTVRLNNTQTGLLYLH